MESGNETTRRTFLQTMGTVPSVTLLSVGSGQPEQAGAAKFTPIDLSSYWNVSPRQFGSDLSEFGRFDPTLPPSGSIPEDLAHITSGKRQLRGIPFLLGPGGDEKSWLVLRQQTVEVPLSQQKAGFLCLAQFCDWFSALGSPGSEPDFLKPGEEGDEDKLGTLLAEAVLVYADGGEETFPIRRRFEVGAPSGWGEPSFAARPHQLDVATKLTDPLPQGTRWGSLQTGMSNGSRDNGTLWLWALPNPYPERPLKVLRLRGAGGPLVVCGLTLFHGREHPLRYQRLALYRVTLPEAGAEHKNRWEFRVDLGVVARTYTLHEFLPEAWLAAPDAGIGHRERPVQGGRHLYVELTAAWDATLSLRDAQTGRVYDFDLSRVLPDQELPASDPGARIEVLQAHRVWLHGRVTDSSTGRPTPVRLGFRSREGRYLPPYGHRTEINEGWFQDYGGDVKVMDSSFAYVDGTFQIELPVGEVFVELSKGFEYGVVRQRLNIEAGQRELSLEISPFSDLRARGWMTADTHVHFLSPTTAMLEGQAEGLNLINLLAAHWGDLFTNVADFAHGPLTSPDEQMTVWVGTENRQHLLGHLGLLGGRGDPVYPMSASGPGESYLGDPVWTSMMDWGEACRKREGLVVAAHFPYPMGEIAADLVLGKIDAVEIWSYGDSFNTVRLRDWYRYLNCGYRVPCVGGTDKMGAFMPVGANRTYAYVGEERFDFANWAKAVRKGNTFATTGPLLLLKVDGRVPGEEIVMGSNGGTVQVQVEARGFVPFHKLEVVQNGHMVASREAREHLDEKLKIAGPAWIAARCASRHGPTTNWELGIQAHTSPVYVRVPEQELFSAPAASYMLTLVEGTQTWLDTLATRPDVERFERIQKVIKDARRHLHERLHKHRLGHA